MKNLKKPILFASGLIAALGISAFAFAGPPHGGGGHGFKRGGGGMMGMHLMHLAERLNLTEQQEVQAVRMRRAIRKQAKANKQEMRDAFKSVLLELEKENPDPAKLHKLVDDATARMNKLGHASVDEYLEFHRTLSVEQRQELVDSARLRMERRGKFRKGKNRQ